MVRANIEAERGRLGYTKEQMSKALRVTAKTYNSYINGGAIPSSILEALRDMSGMPIDYLLGLEGGNCTPEEAAHEKADT